MLGLEVKNKAEIDKKGAARCPRLVSQVRGDWVMLILIQICIEGPGFQAVKSL